MSSVWDDPAKVELAKRLWTEGWSGSEIAARIGGINRGAVIGKMHRLGLSSRSGHLSGSIMSRQMRQRSRQQKPFSFGSKSLMPPAERTQHHAEAFACSEAAAAKAEPDIPQHERQTLLIRGADGKLYANDAFTQKSCKWVLPSNTVGGMAEFCARTKVDGLSYCEAHAARARGYRVSEGWIPAVHFPKGGPTDRTRELEAFDEMGQKDGVGVRVKESA